MFATGISNDGDGVSARLLSRRPSLSPPQDWLCGEKSLDHLVQALDHDGWWSAFGSLLALITATPTLDPAAVDKLARILASGFPAKWGRD
jgi:hypothetical protein